VPEALPIEIRVQQVQSHLSVPDAEAWRVARDVSDAARWSHRPGKIDIRECVNLIAKRKPVDILPRLKARRASRDPTVLIDSRLLSGVFRADVEQLVGALHSMGGQSQKRSQPIIRRFSQWYVMDLATGSLIPFKIDRQIAWYVIITGGKPATYDNLADVKLLTDRIVEDSRVTIVWIGDELPELQREEARKWIAYRP
jgi:hypothetical protein